MGSSFNAPAHLRHAEEAEYTSRDATSITCNGGLALVNVPTYYLVFSRKGEMKFRGQYVAAQRRGTKVIAANFQVSHPRHPQVNRLGRNDAAFPRMICGHNPGRPKRVDALINVGPYSAEPPTFRRGEYCTRLSGLLCLMFAVNNGAKTVTIVGFEGYRKGVPHYFDKRRERRSAGGDHKAETWTRDFYGPVVQSVVNACPDVFFTFMGRPCFGVVGKNVYISGDAREPVSARDPDQPSEQGEAESAGNPAA